MLWQSLEQIGLTEKEAKAYLVLLENDHLAASTLSNKIGVNRTSSYLVLKSIIEKGIKTSTKKENTTVYQANEPTSLLTFLQKQKNEMFGLYQICTIYISWNAMREKKLRVLMGIKKGIFLT